MEAKEVWTDHLTAWAPDRREQSGTLYSFAPSPSPWGTGSIPGTITFSASGFLGSTRMSAGPYSVVLGSRGHAERLRHAWGLRHLGEPQGGHAQIPRLRLLERGLHPPSPSPPPRSTVQLPRHAVSVTRHLLGAPPGTLCYDENCEQSPPGRYTAPGESVVRTWTNTYTRSCPQDGQGASPSPRSGGR